MSEDNHELKRKRGQRGPSDPWPRFTDRFVVEDSGCWVWMGRILESGYGQIGYKGKQIPAHRLAYLLFKGDIPEGMHIDHLCRNKACVNPDHLEAVTPSVNQQRMGVHRRKSITHCKHGHEFTPENTIWKKTNGTRQCRICTNLREHDAQRRRRAKLKALGVRRKDRDSFKLTAI